MLGRLLADAGGAQRIAPTMLNYSKINLTAVCSAFIVGIALFFGRFNSSVPILSLLPVKPKHRCLRADASGLLVAHGFAAAPFDCYRQEYG